MSLVLLAILVTAVVMLLTALIIAVLATIIPIQANRWGRYTLVVVLSIGFFIGGMLFTARFVATASLVWRPYDDHPRRLSVVGVPFADADSYVQAYESWVVLPPMMRGPCATISRDACHIIEPDHAMVSASSYGIILVLLGILPAVTAALLSWWLLNRPMRSEPEGPKS